MKETILSKRTCHSSYFIGISSPSPSFDTRGRPATHIGSCPHHSFFYYSIICQALQKFLCKALCQTLRLLEPSSSSILDSSYRLFLQGGHSQQTLGRHQPTPEPCARKPVRLEWAHQAKNEKAMLKQQMEGDILRKFSKTGY